MRPEGPKQAGKIMRTQLDAPHRCNLNRSDAHRRCRESQFGILPGWYGMENGQKPEMEKNGGGKNGQKMDFRGSFPLFSIFWPFLPPSSVGPFSISISIIFPFPAFGRFPCHASPAGSQITIDFPKFLVSWMWCLAHLVTQRKFGRSLLDTGHFERCLFQTHFSQILRNCPFLGSALRNTQPAKMPLAHIQHATRGHANIVNIMVLRTEGATLRSAFSKRIFLRVGAAPTITTCKTALPESATEFSDLLLLVLLLQAGPCGEVVKDDEQSNKRAQAKAPWWSNGAPAPPICHDQTKDTGTGYSTTFVKHTHTHSLSVSLGTNEACKGVNYAL